MDVHTVLARLRRRWALVAAVSVLAVLGTAIALSTRSGSHERTVHFVLRPASSVPAANVPGALDELKSDGALVQTILGVLGSDDMLRRAATASGVKLQSGYGLSASARPSSALIDATIHGPDNTAVDRLSGGLVRAASAYVGTSYSAYALDVVGSDAGGSGAGLDAAQAIALALVLGAALGVALVVAELWLEPRLRPAGVRPAWGAGGRCRATTSKGTPCRNRAVDERGYCRMHLARAAADASSTEPRENGSPRVLAFGEPEPRERRFRRAGGAAQIGGEDEG